MQRRGFAGSVFVLPPDPGEPADRTAGDEHPILEGDRAADIPFDQPGKLQLIVNRKAATTTGIELSPTLRVDADEVVE